jgi:hypothetical protein
MPTRCIVKDCASVSDSDIQPEPGWALLKVSQINAAGGVLVSIGAGAMCPTCLEAGRLPPMRSAVDQVVTPPKPEPAPAPPPEEKQPPAEETPPPAAAEGPRARRRGSR